MFGHWQLESLLLFSAISLSLSKKLEDPCAELSGSNWASPKEVRACITSFKLEPLIKANTIEAVNKTLAFHASLNYQLQAPPPFNKDIHEDLHADLARISQQHYSSEFAFHLDIYRTFKRVNDGHCGVFNYCYDSLYVTYLPLPLVLLTSADGSQHIHIAPEAFTVASNEFPVEIDFWQQSLPGKLKGHLASLSGAKVHLINGRDPWIAVNESAETIGGYQSFATRQNSFFASYTRGDKGWQYSMGNFAQQIHPLVDSVQLTVQRVNSTSNDTFTIPYRSRFGSASKKFTDSETYRLNNCVATPLTNGRDYYPQKNSSDAQAYLPAPAVTPFFQQHPPVDPSDEYSRKQPMNVILDGSPLTDISLPEHMQPSLPALNSSYSVAEFFMLKDNVTGVLALGSFVAPNYQKFGQSLLNGLEGLKKRGAKKLIVDVTNNGGGYICIAQFLHRVIIGPRSTTEPHAGLQSTARASPLPGFIVKKISAGGDPRGLLYYNPKRFTNASHHPFSSSTNWMTPVENVVVNGRKDTFSQRLGVEQLCQAMPWDAPDYALFKPEDILIISNGRCASSCGLFSIPMAKYEGVRTVVVGGKKDQRQEYCGTIGGESVFFPNIDSDIKSTKLKNNTLAPPDFLANIFQGVTWRLAYGIDNPEEPEEWQEHWADISFPLTLETVNNPVAIWESLAKAYLRDDNGQTFRVQTS